MKKSIQLFFILTGFIFSSQNLVAQDAGAVNKKNAMDSINKQLKHLTEKNLEIERNKKMVADFYQELFGDKNIEAIDKYIGDLYIQHNPSVTDGKEALKNAVKVWFKGAPKEKINIQHLSADGDLVYIHTKSQRGDKTYSVIDIFRIENNKIVEHWDVVQEVPLKSANPHPMF
jgi:predicted SnoaL-like aldol condensation-catalyzing enzyme